MSQADPALVTQLADAFKSSASLLALSRSPLARSPLAEPALVLDDLTPTLDERGQALRHALQWLVEQLAPEPAAYPFGIARPADDPTWREPRWWRYSILRHRWLEPFAPEPRSTAERRSPLDALLSVTGIPSTETYLDERDRALREAAGWAQRQFTDGAGTERIRALALHAVYTPLTDAALAPALALLGLASVFSGPFAREELMALAVEEGLRYPDRALDLLLARRCLLAGEGGAALWMAAPLRAYVASRQLPEAQRRRSLQAARMALAADRALDAAALLVEAEMPTQAAHVLLAVDPTQRIDARAQVQQLAERIQQASLPVPLAQELALLLADLYEDAGFPDQAIAVCLGALHGTPDRLLQARIYRRLGTLYGSGNIRQAFASFARAIERLDAGDPELAALLKARGTLAAHCSEWSTAEADLDRALELLPADALGERADVHDALSSLRRGLEQYPHAVRHAQAALRLREEAGDLMRVGRTYNTLGILYRLMGEYGSAIEAYRAAHALFERVGNQALAATALLNIGTAHHFAEQLAEAEVCYRKCLTQADEMGLPPMEVRARANLCEALMDQDRASEALLNWRAGYALAAREGLEDEVAYFAELCARYPSLASELSAAESAMLNPQAALPETLPYATIEPGAPVPTLDSDEQTALDVALRSGRVNAAALMDAAQVSKATATRKLTRLAESGLLVKHGQGRSTYYTRAHKVPALLLAGDLAGLQSRLDAVLPRFAASHALDRLEARRVVQAASPGGDAELGYEVRALFRRTPDLDGFFELERALSRAARAVILLRL